MLHLFHGELVDASRKELQLVKAKFQDQEVVVFEGKKISPTDLIQATETSSLFEMRRLVIVENLFSKRLNKKITEQEVFFTLIQNLPKTTEIIFWEEKELSKIMITHLPRNIDIAVFRPDRVVFSFLDALRPKNTAQMLDLFAKAIHKDAPELIFSLLVRQFRFLLWIKIEGKKVPDLTPWQISKFMHQQAFFTLSNIYKLYQKLLFIDEKIKTGTSPLGLTSELKLFLIEI